MVFSSGIFVFAFLPTTILGFWFFSRWGRTATSLWLCAVSFVFYSWWDIRWLPVLAISIVFNFLIGRLIIVRANAGRPVDKLLFLGITANVLALIYYKYLGTMLESFGIDFHSVGLPLGISFFTFTQIAFLVDISQGFHQRYTPLNYTLFVAFFPHLIAGPIVHHRDLMPQFEDKKNAKLHLDDLAVGLAIFSIGLAKKTLIADNMSKIADPLLDSWHLTPGLAWIGALSYSMQLYFDFSGYSDMAIGLARMFGVKFPINFDSPYKATSIIDFWQRWHITLTRFLTSYLYNPIALTLVRRRVAAGRSASARASKTPGGFLELIAVPTMMTILLAGVWHGAGLQFLVFGALHGTYISINHAWRTLGPKLERMPRWLEPLVYGGLVYLCVLIAQIFFRAPSVGQALSVLSDMFFLRGGSPSICPQGIASCVQTGLPGNESPVSTIDLTILAGSIGIALFFPNTQQLMAKFDPVIPLGRHIDGSPVLIRFTKTWAVALGVVLSLGLISIKSGQPFIYFQF